MTTRKIQKSLERGMTDHLFEELERLRDGGEITRTSAMTLARFDYCFIRETRVYEQGASRKIYRYTITRAGREALELRARRAFR